MRDGLGQFFAERRQIHPNRRSATLLIVGIYRFLREGLNL
jgi:hypothetical protein